VGGATVQWGINNGATLTACNGASTCTVLTDDSGKVETRVDVRASALSATADAFAGRGSKHGKGARADQRQQERRRQTHYAKTRAAAA